MNRHLTLLSSEAYSYATEHANEFSPEFMGFYDKKFAELIINDCISQCKVVGQMALITNDGEMARKTEATAISCTMMIKEHFGVKE